MFDYIIMGIVPVDVVYLLTLNKHHERTLNLFLNKMYDAKWTEPDWK